MNILPLRASSATFGLLLLFSLPAAADDGPESDPSLGADWHTLYETAIHTSPTGQTLPYRLLRPKRLQPDRQYPLVLFLHGAGERGDDNRSSLVHAAAEFARPDRREEYPAFVVIPQCPTSQRWVESDWSLPQGQGQIPEEPAAAMSLALQLVDTLVSQEPIDPSRLYVTGLSMGSQGAWFAAAAPPRRFAALLAVCGGCDPDWAARFAGVSVWAFHGQQDTVVPVSRSREMIVALTQAGHTPELRYVEYPQVEHNSWTQTFARDDVFEWLFSKQRPGGPATASQ